LVMASPVAVSGEYMSFPSESNFLHVSKQLCVIWTFKSLLVTIDTHNQLGAARNPLGAAMQHLSSIPWTSSSSMEATCAAKKAGVVATF
jgi:hypothetical protein